MSEPIADSPPFDPWTVTVEELSTKAYILESRSRLPSEQDAEQLRARSQWLLEVLQSRTVLEAAKLQRRQTFWLVLGTWALVLATIGLVVVAIFFGPEVVVEVP